MSVGSGVVTTTFFVMFGLFFMFTLYLQFVRGYSPLNAGLATLPLALTLVAVAPRSASVAEKIGSGTVISIGFLFVAAGFSVLSFVHPDTPYLVLVVALVLLGAGMSFTAAPATGNIMSAVPHYKAGVGSAVNDTTREVGGALGIAVLGSIASAVYRSSVNLDGLTLPPPVLSAAKESVGAASAMSQGLPEGREVATRAGTAFTHAFTATSRVAVALCLLAAAVVFSVFNRKAELAANPQTTTPSAPPMAPEPELADEIS